MTQSLPKRSEVAIEETWNLNDLFPSDAAFESALQQLDQQIDRFVSDYAGKLSDAASVLAALEAFAKIEEAAVPVGHYIELALSVDQSDMDLQMKSGKLNSFFASVGSRLAFFKSELLALPDSALHEAAMASDEYARYIRLVLRDKPYQLHPEAEKAIASLSPTFAAPYELYNTTKLVDMRFPSFEADGKTHPLSYVLYENDWEVENDPAIRHGAFQAFSAKLKEYEHTTAKTYDMQLQNEKILSKLRGFDSVIDYLLFPQEVSRDMYNRQIDVIMKELAPHMRRYAKLLQRTNGIEKMTWADLKISLDPSYEPKVSIEESKEYIFKALDIMGDEYKEMVRRSYDERWIDFANNEGKSTGAFCSSPYGSHPYILISWSERMTEVFVLAHELGHAGHFHLANQNQNILNTDVSLYFVEAPSTMNEMLMANHLLQESSDPKFKRWVIASIIARTYYHNFVTHLLEAAYQRKVYEHIDAGGNVHADLLSGWTRDVFEEFWGDAVEINEGAELTWMRQPHYYMGLYPYTYSAGLTVATQMAQRVLKEGQPAVDEWLNVLKAGSTKGPVELAQMAGVDVTTEQPLRDTIAYIGGLIDELEALTDELEANA